MVSLAGPLRATGAILTALVLVGCSGATEPEAPPVTAPVTPAATEAGTTETTMTPETTAATTETTTASMETTSAETDAAGNALTLAMSDSNLGEILVDGNGVTLYLFTNDTQGADASTCEGQCLVNWPPLVGEPMAGEGVDDSLLGSFTKPDGTVQATYNGWPLYYWIQDTEPGQTTGQGVQGVWFVLDRDGEAVGG
ncbi:hypothetical protein FOJ82_10910 [Tessaracoccus rhinocerotis]|uniref:Lipoprotein with Yx(FWY)xxD motif n=1 Tax=Tessaracoccus rhinocerotis TaxID=1689449 RepID=A0A553JZ92_9ACTN|nr:hypothetical protein [Tessaracoccus rhinocerotis]TRY17778.1 hypothetical protein FOJ82_10910 [Tessaracoccus rhinocerotis]